MFNATAPFRLFPILGIIFLPAGIIAYVASLFNIRNY